MLTTFSPVSAFDKKDGPLTAEEEEQRTLAKHKMLGNIKFIGEKSPEVSGIQSRSALTRDFFLTHPAGELGKLEMLHESILHKCIQQLLEKKRHNRAGIKDTAEDLECLCQIMRTCGRILDTDKARSLMHQYFDRMKSLAYNQDMPSRIRFMLQDVLELREKKVGRSLLFLLVFFFLFPNAMFKPIVFLALFQRWVPRKVLTDNGPKTIQQVREEAAKVRAKSWVQLPSLKKALKFLQGNYFPGLWLLHPTSQYGKESADYGPTI